MGFVNAAQLASYIGYEAPATPWHLVDQQQINQFADATLDHQFIHVDPERAAATPFGATIAHGFLTLSMLSHFAESFGLPVEGVEMGINYGFDSVRFLAPVTVGSRIRAHSTIIDIVEKKPHQFMFKTELSVEIEGSDTPALAAVWLTLLMVK
ncbi:MaoC family dehydratase [Porticoccaceae bacterium]|nr:MaoC family dehydratase [Porticoccaceae bacterium]